MIRLVSVQVVLLLAVRAAMCFVEVDGVACLAADRSDVGGEGVTSSSHRDLTDNVCGPNCLYMLLQALGHRVSAEQWRTWHTASPDGMSMLALKQACGQYGVKAEVRRCSVLELVRLRRPAIAHMDMGLPRPNHYVLVTGAVKDGRVEVIDGTTAEVKYYPTQTITNIWTGNLLVVREPRGVAVVVAGACVLLSGFGLLSLRQRRRGR